MPNSIMDDTLTTHLLSSVLPPEFFNLVNTHILNPRSPLQVVKNQILKQGHRVYTALLPLLQPLIARFLSLMQANQGVVDMLIPVLVIVSFFVVLNWIRRIVMWWTRLAMRAVFWAAVAALAAWVWNRGVFVSAKDATIVGAKIMGYMGVVKNVWLDEYKRYEGQQATGHYGYTQGRSSGR